MPQAAPQAHPSEAPLSAGKIADTVLKAFKGLKKTGKPQSHEHTVLAGNSVNLPITAKYTSSDAHLSVQGL